MSINALSPNRFTSQQARLNPQVAQQRQGVTFSSESRVAFQQAGQLISAVKGGSYNKESGSLYHTLCSGIERLIYYGESLAGELRTSLDPTDSSRSRVTVLIQNRSPHLENGADRAEHSFWFFPNTDPQTVDTDFERARAFAITEEEKNKAREFEVVVGSKVSEDVKALIEGDAEELFPQPQELKPEAPLP